MPSNMDYLSSMLLYSSNHLSSFYMYDVDVLLSHTAHKHKLHLWCVVCAMVSMFHRSFYFIFFIYLHLKLPQLHTLNNSQEF